MQSDHRVIELAMELLRRPSVTPQDAGCLDLISQYLQPLGFHCERMPRGQVDNLWALHGQKRPWVVFAGHTDVVPPGPVERWKYPPFQPTLDNDRLYGRGAADMKGSLAAMLVACERFIQCYPDYSGSIGFMLTSDEEGVATDGTRFIVEQLQRRQQLPDYCIVGEPSSLNRVGDTIKVGRRGSLNAVLQVQGIQGHVAYPDRARNPIHQALPALHALAQHHWDDGNAFFPATSLQISNIQSGTGANNVIPGSLSAVFNFRFNTEQTPTQLIQTTEQILNQYHLNFQLDWQLSGLPFLTSNSPLLHSTIAAITRHNGVPPETSTSGGTSDGRFLAPLGVHVVELGPVNATIHQMDEWVSVNDLQQLTRIYQSLLENLLIGASVADKLPQ